MTENYTDYDLYRAILATAAKLGIEGCSPESGVSPKDVFSKIEERCPEAAQILLERTFEKDKLRNYIESSPRFPKAPNGGIDGEGDLTFELHWARLVELYPMLLDAVRKCSGT